MKKNVGDTNNNPLCSIVIVIKKQMLFRQKELSPQLKERLKEYVYDVIGHLFKVYKELPCGFPEYIYQDALGIEFTENSVPFKKEYIFHPLFRGKPLMSYFKMDFMLERSRGNIIIECKAIDEIGEKERHQLFSYMSGSQFPIGYSSISLLIQKPRLKNIIMTSLMEPSPRSDSRFVLVFLPFS